MALTTSDLENAIHYLRKVVVHQAEEDTLFNTVRSLEIELQALRGVICSKHRERGEANEGLRQRRH